MSAAVAYTSRRRMAAKIESRVFSCAHTAAYPDAAVSQCNG